jgi:ankyrin repeat protein
LLPFYSSEQLEAGNNVGNTALHWAASNGHLAILRLLVPALPKSALFLQNKFGKTALSEAEVNVPVPKEGEAEQSDEERAKNKHLECAGYLLTFMELGAKDDKEEGVEDTEERPIDQAREAHQTAADAEVASSVEKMALSSSSQSSKTETPGR